MLGVCSGSDLGFGAVSDVPSDVGNGSSTLGVVVIDTYVGRVADESRFSPAEVEIKDSRYGIVVVTGMKSDKPEVGRGMKEVTEASSPADNESVAETLKPRSVDTFESSALIREVACPSNESVIVSA